MVREPVQGLGFGFYIYIRCDTISLLNFIHTTTLTPSPLRRPKDSEIFSISPGDELQVSIAILSKLAVGIYVLTMCGGFLPRFLSMYLVPAKLTAAIFPHSIQLISTLNRKTSAHSHSSLFIMYILLVDLSTFLKAHFTKTINNVSNLCLW